MTRPADMSRPCEHGETEPCTRRYLTGPVVSICREWGGRRVIDLGCGNGTLCRDLVDAGFSVVGIEPGASGIARARERVPEGRFYEMGVYDDPSGVVERDFDLAISTEVIEHLFRPAALPRFASAKLKKGGVLIVSTPFHGYLKNLLIAVVNGWDAHHTPLWDGGHIKFWSRKSLACLLESNGFEVVGFRGAGRFPGIWKTMILVARKKE